MRVKLSYTVDAADVLKETAKILNLSAEDLQQGISLFNTVQEELRGNKGEDDEIPNTARALEMIREFRVALLNLDTRLSEVESIVEGYVDYTRAKEKEGPPPLAGETEPDYVEDMFGAD